jgi:hypothetical protein
MPDLGFDRCATCSYGPEFSRTSVGASARVSTARGARKPRETATAPVSVRAGSPRRRLAPTARELRDNGLDRVERSEVRTRGEEIIRAVLLS